MHFETVLCVINDIQITHGYDASAAKNVVKAINNLSQNKMTWPKGLSCAGEPIGKPAAVFINGDLTQNAGDLNFVFPGKQIDQFNKIFHEGLHSRMYAGLGNHDLSPEPEKAVKKPDEGRNQMWDYIRCLYKGYTRTEGTEMIIVKPSVRGVTNIDAHLERRLSSGFGSNDNVQPPSWKKYSFNYSLDLDQTHFVQMHRCAGDARWGRAGGLKWLAEDLANVGTNRPVIICQHFGLTGSDCVGTDSDTTWTQAQIDTFIKIIRPYNVVAMFVGHDHQVVPHYTYEVAADTNGPAVDIDLFNAGSVTVYNEAGGHLIVAKITVNILGHAFSRFPPPGTITIDVAYGTATNDGSINFDEVDTFSRTRSLPTNVQTAVLPNK